jgi:hypothetical protein
MARAAVVDKGGNVLNVIDADYRTALAPDGCILVDATNTDAAPGATYSAEKGGMFIPPPIAAVVDPETKIVVNVIFADAARDEAPAGKILVNVTDRSIAEGWRMEEGTNTLRAPTPFEINADRVLEEQAALTETAE